MPVVSGEVCRDDDGGRLTVQRQYKELRERGWYRTRCKTRWHHRVRMSRGHEILFSYEGACDEEGLEP